VETQILNISERNVYLLIIWW